MNHENNALSNEILIARVARGDRHALETLYDRHAATVLGILLRIVGEPVAAENRLQETFWQVWQNAPNYSSQNGSFTTWLFRLARNLVISSRNEPPQEILEKPGFRLQGKPAQNISENISSEQRQILEMAYFHGMTGQQIANVTGHTLNTVRTLARLGLQKLSEELKTQEDKSDQEN